MRSKVEIVAKQYRDKYKSHIVEEIAHNLELLCDKHTIVCDLNLTKLILAQLKRYVAANLGFSKKMAFCQCTCMKLFDYDSLYVYIYS